MSFALTSLIVLILQGQPIVRDNLVKDLICLFIQKMEVKEVTESGMINYRTLCKGEDEIIEIEYIPCTVKSDTNWELKPVSCEWPMWRIVFTESHFNPFLTNKYDGTDNDISDINELINRYQIELIGEEWLDSHPVTDVDILPVFVDGDKNIVLSHIIKDYFRGVQLEEFIGVPSKVPFVANIIIDKTGTASFKSLIKDTGNPYLDNIATLVAKDFCKYKFKPAVHRGKTVMYSMNIPITQKEWFPYLVE